MADAVHYVKLESGEQPGMNGWYWTDDPAVLDAQGICDIAALHGPFKTEQAAVENYEASRSTDRIGGAV
jgi:hypothetical protein